MFAWNRFSLTVKAAIVALMLSSTGVFAGEAKNNKILHFTTAHFDKPILLDGKTVSIEAKLDGNGSGKGTLSLDPNLWKGKYSTLMACTYVKVALKEVKADESAKKGRTLYEVTGKGLDRVFLSVSLKEGGPCWLLIGNNEGSQDIIEMTVVDNNLRPANLRELGTPDLDD